MCQHAMRRVMGASFDYTEGPSGPSGPPRVAAEVADARAVTAAELTARLLVYIAEGLDAERMAKRLVAEFRGCVIAG